MMKNLTKTFLLGLLLLAGLTTSMVNAAGKMKDIELDPGKQAVAPGNYVYWTNLTGTNEIGVRFHFDTDGETAVRFFDLRGQEVMAPTMGQTRSSSLFEVSFDQSELPNGVYFAAVTNNGVTITTKFVVSH